MEQGPEQRLPGAASDGTQCQRSLFASGCSRVVTSTSVRRFRAVLPYGAPYAKGTPVTRTEMKMRYGSLPRLRAILTSFLPHSPSQAMHLGPVSLRLRNVSIRESIWRESLLTTSDGLWLGHVQFKIEEKLKVVLPSDWKVLRVEATETDEATLPSAIKGQA